MISQAVDAAHGMTVHTRARGCGGGGTKPSKSLTTMVILRGRGAKHEILNGSLAPLNQDLHSDMAHEWHMGGPVAAASCEHSLSSLRAHDKVATVVSNSQTPIPLIEHAAIRATEMLYNKVFP